MLKTIYKYISIVNNMITTTKEIIMDGLGTHIDSNYYPVASSTVSQVETTSFIGMFNQALTSSNFGASGTCVIPNNNFIGATYLFLQVPYFPNLAYPKGWGLNSIESITYTWGASNMSNVILSGDSLRHALTFESDNSSKMEDALNFSGAELNRTSGNLSFWSDKLTAMVRLPLPWSSNTTKKWFDASTILDSIIVKINFRRANEFLIGVTANNFTNSFSQALILTKQGQLSDQSASLKMSLFNNPNYKLMYPFVFFQSAPITNFTIPVNGGLTNTLIKQTINLYSFINSDLLGIILSCRNITTNSITRNTTTIMYDIVLKINGQIVYYAPGISSGLYNNDGHDSNPSYISLTQNATATDLSVVGTVPPFGSVVSWDTIINFSQFRCTALCDHLENVKRYPNQTMTLSFSVSREAPKNNETEQIYELVPTYAYQAGCLIQNGTTRLVF